MVTIYDTRWNGRKRGLTSYWHRRWALLVFSTLYQFDWILIKPPFETRQVSLIIPNLLDQITLKQCLPWPMYRLYDLSLYLPCFPFGDCLYVIWFVKTSQRLKHECFETWWIAQSLMITVLIRFMRTSNHLFWMKVIVVMYSHFTRHYDYYIGSSSFL